MRSIGPQRICDKAGTYNRPGGEKGYTTLRATHPRPVISTVVLPRSAAMSVVLVVLTVSWRLVGRLRGAGDADTV